MASVTRSTKRKSALVFGLVLVVALVVTGVTSGFGGPALSDGDVAVVDGVDDGTVSQEQLDSALTQGAVSLGLEEAPPVDDPQYEGLLNQAMQGLLQAIWVEAEAEDRGVSVPEEEVDAELETTKEQSFGSEKEFNDYLEESDLTLEDARDQLRVSLLTNLLVTEVAPGGQSLPQDIEVLEPPQQLERLTEIYEVDDQAVEDYFESSKDLTTSEGGFTEPPTREARVILNTSRAEIEKAQQDLEAGDLSDEAWRKAATEYSQDQTSKDAGGQLPAPLVEGGGSPFEEQAFAATEGELSGPEETDRGFVLLEVTSATEQMTSSVDDEQVRQQIEAQIVNNRQQQAFEEFKADFFDKWTARTICAPEATVELCSNFEPPAPEPLPGAEEAPEPPPVVSSQPIAPGTAEVPLSFPSGYLPPRGEQAQGPGAGVQLEPAPALPPGSVPIGPDGQPIPGAPPGATGAPPPGATAAPPPGATGAPTAPPPTP